LYFYNKHFFHCFKQCHRLKYKGHTLFSMQFLFNQLELLSLLQFQMPLNLSLLPLSCLAGKELFATYLNYYCLLLSLVCQENCLKNTLVFLYILSGCWFCFPSLCTLQLGWVKVNFRATALSILKCYLKADIFKCLYLLQCSCPTMHRM
jgi:hypothetical protein